MIGNNIPPIRIDHAPYLALISNRCLSSSFPFKNCHELIASTTNPASKIADKWLCTYIYQVYGLKNKVQKSVSIILDPSQYAPTGCCINPFADIIHIADNNVPSVIIETVNNLSLLDNLCLLNNQIPVKVDSKKKAAITSKISGDPNTSPIATVYGAQLVPNWTVIAIPVTIPNA